MVQLDLCKTKTATQKIDKTKILMINGSLMKVESIAERSSWSIQQYLWPALSDNLSWKPIFGIFETGHFTQVLLYFFVAGLCLEHSAILLTCIKQ